MLRLLLLKALSETTWTACFPTKASWDPKLFLWTFQAWAVTRGDTRNVQQNCYKELVIFYLALFLSRRKGFFFHKAAFNCFFLSLLSPPLPTPPFPCWTLSRPIFVPLFFSKFQRFSKIFPIFLLSFVDEPNGIEFSLRVTTCTTNCEIKQEDTCMRTKIGFFPCKILNLNRLKVFVDRSVKIFGNYYPFKIMKRCFFKECFQVLQPFFYIKNWSYVF